MKITRFFAMIFPVVLILVVGLFQVTPAQGEEEESTPLAEAMSQISDSLKKLRRMEKDDWDGGVKAARSALEGCLESMKYTPSLIKDMKDGKEKDKAIADYKRLMGLAYSALAELELAYLEQDAEKVAAAVQKIKGLKKEGHKKYEDD